MRPDRPFAAVPPPVVVKPRFGSGGKSVIRCDDEEALVETLTQLTDRHWFRLQGALIQELVPPRGYDLRVVVAGERVVGAVFRIAAKGEWRTNIALGGVRRPVVDSPPAACEIALAAAAATGTALVGVDLLPDEDGAWTIIELNGAVEFTHEYQPGSDVFADVSDELARVACAELAEPAEPESATAA